MLFLLYRIQLEVHHFIVKNERDNKMKRTLFLLPFVLGIFLEPEAKAGIVKITNASHNNIGINVIPEASFEYPPYCWKCLRGCAFTQTYEVKELIVPANFTKGKNIYFAVTGTEGGFLFNGTCGNLSVLKDYEVLFEETTFGLKCKSKEI